MPKGKYVNGVPFEFYRTYFCRKGWEVHAAGTSRDTCPGCVKKADELRRQRALRHQAQQQRPHPNIIAAAQPDAPQPEFFSYRDVKELQAKFSRRDPDNIRREIRLVEQRLARLRIEIMPFEDVPKPAPPPPIRLEPRKRPRPPLHFWLERLRVKAVNA
jgi:hypothetical protein